MGIDQGDFLGLLKPLHISAFCLLLHHSCLLLGFQLDPSDSSDHLSQLRKSLFAFMLLKHMGEFELLLNCLQSLLIIIAQFDLLPKSVRGELSLDCFHAEVKLTLVLHDSRVFRVTKRARQFRTKPC